MATRRGGAPARRALRSRPETRAARLRAGQRAVHGPDRVPRDGQAGRAAPAPRAALARGRRRTAQSGGDPSLPRRHRPRDPRWVRPDRDGAADGQPARRAGPPGFDGPRAPGSRPARRRRRARTRRPGNRSDLLRRVRGRVVRDEDRYLYFEGRTDRLIISAVYRIGPFEVESALVSHAAVAEAAVV